MILGWGEFGLLGDTWQCLETFLVVTLEGVQGRGRRQSATDIYWAEIRNAAAAAAAKSLQSCTTLCNPRDSSPPGSLIPGILQARTLEWVAISFSKKCS